VHSIPFPQGRTIKFYFGLRASYLLENPKGICKANRVREINLKTTTSIPQPPSPRGKGKS
jgi:hypothetical protein